MDNLSSLQLLYHTHHSQESDDLPFWLAWAQKQGNPILELGCGTGRITLPLIEEGFTVFGLDRDALMLAFLQSQLSDLVRKRLALIQADIRHYCLNTRFPLIIFPCNTYSTIAVPDRQMVLNRVRLHLAAKGVFIVSAPNPNLLADLPLKGEPQIETSFTHPKSGNPVQVSGQWQCAEDVVIINWHYDHLFPDGQVERQTLSTEHYLQEVEKVLGDFSRAGLSILAIYGDYDQSEYLEGAPYLIIVAKNNPREI
jgi:SAM-dependent methyltransferase